jgi:hypothetical protein
MSALTEQKDSLWIQLVRRRPNHWRHDEAIKSRFINTHLYYQKIHPDAVRLEDKCWQKQPKEEITKSIQKLRMELTSSSKLKTENIRG